jgi:glycosyltransferase involved in cell wall biosynthesis
VYYGAAAMKVLHVAAMPFPSVQGTQAAVLAMLEAEHADDRAPELLTYAHAGYEAAVPWPIHRIADLTRDRSLRSGPSWRKIVADAQLIVASRRIARERRVRAVVAHHVEAAAAALAARARPLVFVAHTALGPELPAYLPARAKSIAARAGDALDLSLAARADAVGAVSPWLASRLAGAASREVTYLPVPWSVAPPIEPSERAKARTRFGIAATAPVLLYAGNLDAYQGVELLARAFAIVRERRPDAHLVVASASDHAAIEQTLWSLGCAGAVTFAPLADEPDRRVAHAAADAVCVPRAIEGGLPIKLLDALARGVPTVATRRATAGLTLGGAALVAADDDAEALAAAALIAVSAREASADLGRRGVEYVRREHAKERYLEAMDTLLRRASDARGER